MRPQRVAVKSFTHYFDINIDHFHQKMRLLEVPPFFAWAPLNTPPHDLIYVILLLNDSIFRAVSDNINRFFPVLRPKNSFCVMNHYEWAQ